MLGVSFCIIICSIFVLLNFAVGWGTYKPNSGEEWIEVAFVRSFFFCVSTFLIYFLCYVHVSCLFFLVTFFYLAFTCFHAAFAPQDVPVYVKSVSLFEGFTSGKRWLINLNYSFFYLRPI